MIDYCRQELVRSRSIIFDDGIHAPNAYSAIWREQYCEYHVARPKNNPTLLRKKPIYMAGK
jgi:hypothetical protein